MKPTILSIVALLLSGCATSKYGELSKHLKDDPAVVQLNISSPWGRQTLVRVGNQFNAAVSISQDGIVHVTPRPEPPPVRTIYVTNTVVAPPSPK